MSCFQFTRASEGRIGTLCDFVAGATEWLIASLFVEHFGWIGLLFEEKHWNRGGIKCLDILMEAMVDYW